MYIDLLSSTQKWSFECSVAKFLKVTVTDRDFSATTLVAVLERSS